MRKLSTVKDSRAITGLHTNGDDLIVTFTSGNSYRYEGVGEEMIRELIEADSPGQYLVKEIKPNFEAFPYEFIDEEDDQAEEAAS
jgi:hypothetical protein